MYWLILRVSNWINRAHYDSALKEWAQKKAYCDKRNEELEKSQSLRYDAFAHEKWQDPGPPPDPATFMNRSVSDNAGWLVAFAVGVVFALGATLYNWLFDS